jgi:hypothetical protein
MKRSGFKPRKKPMERTGFKKKAKRAKHELESKSMVELGKIAWKLMSKYIRTRDLNKGCITCGKAFTKIGDMDAGHFKHAAKTNPVSYDERNINGQCPATCNRLGHGKLDVYAEKLVEMYGGDVLAELVRIKNSSIKGKDKREFFYQTIADLKKKIADQENP